MALPEAHLRSILRERPSAHSTQPQVVAFFDLDRTLIAGYSIAALALETARHGARRGELRQAARILGDTMRQKTDRSGGSYHRLVRRLGRALTGVSERTLEKLGESAYHNSLARSLYSEAISLVEAHRAAGHHLVIVSAASRYQIDPIARTLGIDDICCTRLEVVNGHFTGRTIAPLCYGEGKAMAARRVAKRVGTRLQDCWFYSDSCDDLPLLSRVGHPVAVNPSERLAAHAGEQKWPQLHFATRGGPQLETVARTLLTTQAVAATAALAMVSKRLGLSSRGRVNRLTGLLGDVGTGLAGLDLEVDGRQHLHSDRPAIFIFNHQSLLDAVVLAQLLRRDAVGFCKQEMAATPLLGPLLKHMDTIFVDRKASDQSRVWQQALETLSGGRSLVIAPEGTRSTLGNIQPFKHGAFLLAKKAGVPIVPIVLHNMKDALPKGGLFIRPATIRVTVLPPVQPEDMGGVRKLCHSLESRYCELLGNSASAALPFQAKVYRGRMARGDHDDLPRQAGLAAAAGPAP